MIKITETAIVAVFKGDVSGKTTVLRADFDALPIQEANVFEHRSKNENVSHKCGHDGHTAIMLGMANKLSEYPISSGQVILLFQPAEENGEGAKSVLATSFFKSVSVDKVFALHNLPGFPLMEIVIKKGVFTAHVISVIIKIEGEVSHAAEPEKGQNPSIVISKIIMEANNYVNNTPHESSFFLITHIYSEIGKKAYGVSAGSGEVHFTLRAWDKNILNQKKEQLERCVEELCDEEKLQSSIEWLQDFEANYNSEKAVEIISGGAKKLNLSVTKVDTPFRWGEDFGLFTKRYEGAMFGLGAGVNSLALHNPYYDFPDQIIPSGVKMFHQIILNEHE